jgi:phosphate/sulfate permease
MSYAAMCTLIWLIVLSPIIIGGIVAMIIIFSISNKRRKNRELAAKAVNN